MQKTTFDRYRYKNRTTSGDAVKIFGLAEFQRALRKAPKETRAAIARGNKEIASQVVVRMTRKARVTWNVEQYETIVPTIRAVQGAKPKIRIGGSTKAKVSPRMPSGRRRKERPPAGDIVFGAEFGGRNTPETQQFPYRKKGGYVLFPTIRQMNGFIRNEYTRNIERTLKRMAD